MSGWAAGTYFGSMCFEFEDHDNCTDRACMCRCHDDPHFHAGGDMPCWGRCDDPNEGLYLQPGDIDAGSHDSGETH